MPEAIISAQRGYFDRDERTAIKQIIPAKDRVTEYRARNIGTFKRPCEERRRIEESVNKERRKKQLSQSFRPQSSTSISYMNLSTKD